MVQGSLEAVWNSGAQKAGISKGIVLTSAVSGVQREAARLPVRLAGVAEVGTHSETSHIRLPGPLPYPPP